MRETATHPRTETHTMREVVGAGARSGHHLALHWFACQLSQRKPLPARLCARFLHPRAVADQSSGSGRAQLPAWPVALALCNVMTCQHLTLALFACPALFPGSAPALASFPCFFSWLATKICHSSKMLSKAYYISLDGRGRDSTPSCTWTLQWLMNCSSNGKRGNEQSQYRERKRGRAKKSQYASVEFTSLGLTHKYVQISLIYLPNFEDTERERRKEREKEKEW